MFYYNLHTQEDKKWTVTPRMFRTGYGQDIISQIRDATLDHARQLGIKQELVALAERKLALVDIGVFATVVRAGVCANFRYAGQVVPNRQYILARGGKTFMDIDTITSSAVMYRDIVLKHCTPDTAQVVMNMITKDGTLSSVVCHECNHPIGCTPESDAVLGDVKDRVEEAKATLGGLSAFLSQLDSSKWPEVAAYSVARVCRFFGNHAYENPTSQPYVRENIAMANLLIISEIVSVKDGIAIDFNLNKLILWKKMLRQFCLDVIHAYHSQSPKLAVTKVEEGYCARTPAILNWIKWVNR